MTLHSARLRAGKGMAVILGFTSLQIVNKKFTEHEQ